MGAAPFRHPTPTTILLLLATAASAAPARAAPTRSPAPMVFAPVTLGRSEATPRELKRALRFYERKDYLSATIFLHKLLQSTTGGGPRETAQFYLARALYHLRLYAAALTWFDKIVKAGDGHKHHRDTLLWLTALQRKLPLGAGVLGLIGRYPLSALDAPTLRGWRDELRFYLGRHRYGQGDPQSLKQAVALFGGVARGSTWALKARFFQGVTELRRGRPARAAAAFKSILRQTAHGTGSPAARRQYAELARLALARVFYQAGQTGLGAAKRSAKARQMALYRSARKMLLLSVKYYQSIPRRSPYWLQALFEESWALFALDAQLRRVFKRDFAGYQRSLGNIHTLNAPFFEDASFPETWIVQAVTYFRNCRYAKAREAIRAFQRRYRPQYDGAKGIARRHAGDDYAFHALAQRLRRGTAAVSGPLARLLRTALSDRTYRRQLAYLSELTREMRVIRRASSEWRSTAVASDVLQDLALRQSLEISRAGRAARRRIRQLTKSLGKLLIQANHILYEINNVRLGRLAREAAGQRDVFLVKLQPVKVDDEHVVWPFTGAYWRDELGYYRYVIRNRCTLRKN